MGKQTPLKTRNKEVTAFGIDSKLLDVVHVNTFSTRACSFNLFSNTGSMLYGLFRLEKIIAKINQHSCFAVNSNIFRNFCTWLKNNNKYHRDKFTCITSQTQLVFRIFTCHRKRAVFCKCCCTMNVFQVNTKLVTTAHSQAMNLVQSQPKLTVQIAEASFVIIPSSEKNLQSHPVSFETLSILHRLFCDRRRLQDYFQFKSSRNIYNFL